MMQKDKRYIAFVCTGNTCRSPMAEGIFNKLAAEKGIEIKAESFGLATISGLNVSENSVKACAEIGVDILDLKSTSVLDAEIEKYEKFYCMSQSHAAMLVQSFFVPGNNIEVLNISDPYGGDEFVYKKCCNEIYNSVQEIIEKYEN